MGQTRVPAKVGRAVTFLGLWSVTGRSLQVPEGHFLELYKQPARRPVHYSTSFNAKNTDNQLPNAITAQKNRPTIKIIITSPPHNHAFCHPAGRLPACSIWCSGRSMGVWRGHLHRGCEWQPGQADSVLHCSTRPGLTLSRLCTCNSCVEPGC